MNREEALILAQEFINTLYKVPDDKLVILEDETIEKPYGWVVFYQSQQYLETGKFSHMLFGNAPILIRKDSARPILLGTAEPVEVYLQEFERGIRS